MSGTKRPAFAQSFGVDRRIVGESRLFGLIYRCKGSYIRTRGSRPLPKIYKRVVVLAGPRDKRREDVYVYAVRPIAPLLKAVYWYKVHRWTIERIAWHAGVLEFEDGKPMSEWTFHVDFWNKGKRRGELRRQGLVHKRR